MARVKGAMMTRKHRNKVLGLAKGYWGNKSRHYKMANEQLMKSGRYAYVGRKQKKRDFRQLWITRPRWQSMTPPPSPLCARWPRPQSDLIRSYLPIKHLSDICDLKGVFVFKMYMKGPERGHMALCTKTD